ncbi:MAG TPA: prepilin-type N-terminal cleavage/methylation domain-containing protein, partial [bacterium]|nr:prepilin-type N-terminal cleavage/methylation domain-containing protein [bacterium]
KGFSLIEVLAAVTILSGVLFAVARIVSASYIYVSKIHNIYLGTELARLKLHEVEEIIKKDGLPETETEEEGEFDRSEYKDFKWKYSIKKVFMPLPDLSPSSGDGTEGQAEEAAGMLSLAKGNIEDFFKERIRKLTLKIYWGAGERESEKVVFTVFLTTEGAVKTFQQFQGNPSKSGNTGIPDGGGERKSDPNYNRFRPSSKDILRNPGENLQ